MKSDRMLLHSRGLRAPPRIGWMHPIRGRRRIWRGERNGYMRRAPEPRGLGGANARRASMESAALRRRANVLRHRAPARDVRVEAPIARAGKGEIQEKET